MNETIVIYAVKAVRVATSYISSTISANFMAQVYMDKVLINQQNPQHLANFVVMFAVIDAIIFAMLLGVFFLTSTLVSSLKLDKNKLLSLLLQDYIIYLIMVCVTGIIISMTMFSKKFFMYKDDGLRAIRAMKEIMFNLSVFHGLVPYHTFGGFV